MIVITVYAPVAGGREGSSWDRQTRAMKVLAEQGESMQDNPIQQLMHDLHGEIWPLMINRSDKATEHAVIIMGAGHGNVHTRWGALFDAGGG